jgi:adenylate cyclase
MGRIVKTIGDGILVEFSSVVDAVECAIEIQQGMAARNSEEPEDRRIDFRIGINLGDVIVEDDDLFGDGVNVAARLEGKADPGAVLISDAVMRQAGGKVGEPFADMGEISLKNIDAPVRAWQWSIDGRPSFPKSGGASTRPSRKSSIAVLPFVNLTNDPEQDYFGDGIVEDIITALSRFSQLFVVARNSTFIYKGQAADVRQIAADLGVTYILEGSVRENREPGCASRDNSYTRKLADMLGPEDSMANWRTFSTFRTR